MHAEVVELAEVALLDRLAFLRQQRIAVEDGFLVLLELFSDLGIQQFELQEIRAVFFGHRGQVPLLVLHVDCHDFRVQRRVQIRFGQPEVLLRLRKDLLHRHDARHISHGLRHIVQLPIVLHSLLAHGL